MEQAFAMIKVEAPQGSTTKMTLPDGTEVWLNAGSRMEYSQGFGVRDRRVKLSGEGYFEVHHNTAMPFIVNSSSLNVQVLGTTSVPYSKRAVVTCASRTARQPTACGLMAP